MLATSGLVRRDPSVLGGLATFPEVRVHADALFIELSAGGTIASFCNHYPSVSEREAVALLRARAEEVVGLEV